MRNENLICTECFVVIPRTNFHLKNDNPVAQLLWGRCMIEKASAFSFYTRGSRIRNIIHNLKYRGIKDAGTELGRICSLSLLSSGFFEGIDAIIPVPLHPSKKRQRGFNQSDCISSGISEVTGLPVLTDSLVRMTKTGTQTRKSRYERWTNVEGIFRVTDQMLLRGRHILLVDDVITTGSTIESCANEILNIEETRVSVLVMAFASF
jgi:ComF family protein